MNPEQFVFWFRGMTEGRDREAPSDSDWNMIMDHLDLVFHKVTPDRSGAKQPEPKQTIRETMDEMLRQANDELDATVEWPPIVGPARPFNPTWPKWVDGDPFPAQPRIYC